MRKWQFNQSVYQFGQECDEERDRISTQETEELVVIRAGHGVPST